MVMIRVDKQSRLTHKVIVDTSAVGVERMCEWCHSQFGRRFAIVDRVNFGRDGTWQCRWKGLDSRSGYYTSGYEFSFDHKQDAVLFGLKWV